MEKNNIRYISENGICCGCGACAAVCRFDAIKMGYSFSGFIVPQIDISKCKECSMCVSVCPSVGNNQMIHNEQDFFHGRVLAAYIGFSTNRRIRHEGQSGGLVSSLLLYLLNKNRIDGAITAHYDSVENNSSAVYVDSEDSIIECAGSYYTQTSPIAELVKHPGKKAAMILLGCQAEAISLMEKHGKISNPPEYKIGLICAGQNSTRLMNRLIDKAEIPPNEKISRFRFRYSHPLYGGWPGNVMVQTNKKKYFLPRRERIDYKPYCASYRCMLCYDQMGIYTDLVCGDPWGIRGSHSDGKTVVLVRTEKGLELIKEAEKAGYIKITPIGQEKIFYGETVDTRHKKKFENGYISSAINGWLYPYCLDCQLSERIMSLPRDKRIIGEYKAYRDYAMAQTKKEIIKFDKYQKQKQYKDRNKRAVINALSIPKRVINKINSKM